MKATCKVTRPGFAQRKTRKQRGVATIEFALLAPVLFLLLCIAMDLGVALWVNLTMQYAVREGARYSVTGDRRAHV